MPTRKKLPEPIGRAAFATSFVDDPTQGVGRGRLRGRDIEHPFHGVNVRRGHVQTIDELCDAYLVRMLPGQYFSHETAAQLFRVPLPTDLGMHQVHVTVTSPRTPPRARGVIGHAIRAETLSVGTLRGKPVCSPADCWCQLAETLSFDDLVAAGDYLISGRAGPRREPALCVIETLTTASDRYGRRKGTHQVKRALGFLRTGVDSRPESHLRLLLISAGFEETLTGYPVSVRGAKGVLHPDLVLERFTIAFEYEGDGHRTDARQWRLDISRRQLLEAEGWHVIRVTSHDLYVDPAGLIRRVREIIAQRAHLGR